MRALQVIDFIGKPIFEKIDFSHSLALHLTAYSLRFATLRCGFRQQVSLGVRPQSVALVLDQR